MLIFTIFDNIAGIQYDNTNKQTHESLASNLIEDYKRQYGNRLKVVVKGKFITISLG